MIVKQKQEHSMIRRQHFVIIFFIHVVLSTVPCNTIKIGIKLAYYIRIGNFYYL